MTKYYLEDPLAVAILSREFGVRFYTRDLVDEVSIATPGFSPRLDWHKNQYSLDVIDQDGRKYYIHHESWHIFKDINPIIKQALKKLNLWPKGGEDE